MHISLKNQFFYIRGMSLDKYPIVLLQAEISIQVEKSLS